MHFSNLCLLATALVSIVIAAPKAHQSHVYSVHEKRERTHPSWKLVNRAAPEAVVPVRIGLRQSNLDEGVRLFDDITDFYSPNYGKWWTPEEIRDFFAPHQDDVESVRAWLSDAGVDASRISQSANKQWIQFDAPIAELETLLRTHYHEYEHKEGGRLRPACDQYHVPAHLSEVIDYITPSVSFGWSSRRSGQGNKAKRSSIQAKDVPLRSKSLTRASREQHANSTDFMATCAYAASPACILAMYNITAGTTATPGNELGIFEAPIFPYSQKDLDDFFAYLYPTIPAGTGPNVNAVDGAEHFDVAPDKINNPEANFDMQISYPIIWPQNVVYFEVGDPYYNSNPEIFSQYFQGLMDDFLYSIDGSYCSDTSFGVGLNNSLDTPYPDSHPGGYKQKTQCGLFKAPNVFSTSYGAIELYVPVSFSRRQCLEWMKLGMQGTSVLVASGDNGVDCDEDDNRVFAPDYIASCPYVTAVGATALPPYSSPDAPQIATTYFYSGGGFSNIFPRPAYQNQSVKNYLNRYPPPFTSYSTLYNQSVGTNGGVFNRAGRAFPDVAALGQFIAGWSMGKPLIVSGTSAAAPLFGAILTRINEVRLQQGKSTVGFVNPVLYAHPELFNDVTIGSNSNNKSDTPCKPTSPGFRAAPGWDPVTGLGTPKFQALMDFWTS